MIRDVVFLKGLVLVEYNFNPIMLITNQLINF